MNRYFISCILCLLFVGAFAQQTTVVVTPQTPDTPATPNTPNPNDTTPPNPAQSTETLIDLSNLEHWVREQVENAKQIEENEQYKYLSMHTDSLIEMTKKMHQQALLKQDSIMANNKFAQNIDSSVVKVFGQPFDTLPVPIDIDISWDSLEHITQICNNLNEVDIDSTRNRPNAITVFSRRDLQQMGARDLLDVLTTVPGFEFAMTEDGGLSLGIRGNWANEGKVLLLVDGIEMNDAYSGRLNFGNHFPIELIDYIEIVRGPGSATYGGFAELGVINIVTRNAHNFSGISYSYKQSKAKKVYLVKNHYVYFGVKYKKFSLTTWFATGQGLRSNRDNYAFYKDSTGMGTLGGYTSLTNNSHTNPGMSHLNLSRGRFSFTFLTDGYSHTDVRMQDTNGVRNVRVTDEFIFTQIKQGLRLFHNQQRELIVTPKLGLTFQRTKSDDNFFEALDGYSNNSVRIRGNFDMEYKHNHRNSFIIGSEFVFDMADMVVNEKIVNDIDTTKNASMTTSSVYGQYITRFPVVNLILGARYEQISNRYGDYSYWAPRVGLTKRRGGYHYKIMFGKAYKSPTIGNILNAFDGDMFDSLGTADHTELRNEQTLFTEFEFGFRLKKWLYLTTNVYAMNIKDPIMYGTFHSDLSDFNPKETSYLKQGFSGYRNYAMSGTSGIETTLKIVKDRFITNISYSYHNPNNKGNFYTTDPKEIFSNKQYMLAFAKHRLTFNEKIRFSDNFHATLSMNMYGNRYSYKPLRNGNTIQWELMPSTPTLVANTYFSIENLFNISWIDIGAGVYNIFNSNYEYLQPSRNLTPSMPIGSRQYVFDATFDVEFKKRKHREPKE